MGLVMIYGEDPVHGHLLFQCSDAPVPTASWGKRMLILRGVPPISKAPLSAPGRRLVAQSRLQG